MLVRSSVLDRIPYMVWTYDENGEIDYVNPAWIKATGLSVHEATQAPTWYFLLDPDQLAAFLKSLQASMRDGVAFAHEIRLKHRDESDAYRWHSIRIEPTLSEDQRIVGWTGTAIDIDARVSAERSLLERDMQYQHERHTSTMFQRAALPPHLPTVAGLSFDAVYEPGLSDAQVGGDWYDAVRLLDGRVLLSIGDVSGSGLNAAVIMSVVRQIMRGIVQLHPEPAMMLDAADRALRLEYPDALVTAWVGIFDLVGRTLHYASAGHPPPLLLTPSGHVQELDHLTLPIGLRQGHQGHASSITIEDGSEIWLYTDGLIEASRDIVQGTQSLLETAHHLGTGKATHPASAIRSRVIPNGAPDDVAILVVRTNFSDAELSFARWHFDSSDAHAASVAREAFTSALSRDYFSDVDRANAEIVFVELCGNVVRHAPGPVDVILDFSTAQCVLHVLDRGAGFRHLSRLPRDPFAERGRGLFIIEAMTTEFTVSQRGGGGSEARAVLVGKYPVSLLLDQSLPAVTDQVPETF